MRASPDAGPGGGTTITVDFPALRAGARTLDRQATASRAIGCRPAATLSGLDAPADTLVRARARVAAAADAIGRLTDLLERATADVSRREGAYRAIEDVELADRALAFAPVLRLHPDEGNLPTDPRSVLARARRDGRNLVIDPADYAGSRNPPRMLVEVSPDGSRITYWIFHAFNDGPGPQNHQGDWERTTIHFGRDGRPDDVVMSGHESHNRRRWDEMERTADGRPVIYSSKGSHALQPAPGRWPTDFPGIEDEARRGGREIDLARLPVADIRDEPYYGTGDRHGRDSNSPLDIIGLDGPDGPGPAKSHIELDDAAVKNRNGPRIRLGPLGIPIAPFELPIIDPPRIALPRIDPPRIALPRIDPPSIDLPRIDAPPIEIPRLPRIDLPAVDLPDIDLPTVDLPDIDLPELDLPRIDVRGIPGL